MVFQIFALFRSPENPQLFGIEYVRGFTRSYLCTDRDALLSSLMDGVRASGNQEIHVQMAPTKRGKETNQVCLSFFIIGYYWLI